MTTTVPSTARSGATSIKVATEGPQSLLSLLKVTCHYSWHMTKTSCNRTVETVHSVPQIVRVDQIWRLSLDFNRTYRGISNETAENL